MYALPQIKDYSAESLNRISAELTTALEADAESVRNEKDWRAFRDHWMSRKSGVTTQLNELLRAAPKEAKREAGRRVNELKARIEQLVAKVEERLIVAVDLLQRAVAVELDRHWLERPA